MYVQGYMLFIFAVATCVLQQAQVIDAQDPCINVKYLNQNWRNVHQPVDESYGGHCDSQLEKRWYRFTNGGGDDMPTVAPPQGNCSTYFPAWLNGSLPTVSEGLVYRSVCLYNTNGICGSTWFIQMKNCSGYYVYELQPTLECPAAYCIGTKKSCSDGQLSNTGYEPCLNPNVSTPIFNGTAKLTVEAGQLPNGGHIYLFKCTAPPVQDGENQNLTQFTVVYRYEWIMREIVLIDNVIQESFQTITEYQLKNVSDLHFPGQSVMGNNLTCRISVTYGGLNEYYSDIVEDSKFLGIQFITTTVRLCYRDGTWCEGLMSKADIQMKSTIPFLCHLNTPGLPCMLWIEVVTKPQSSKNAQRCNATDVIDDIVIQNPECYFKVSKSMWTAFNISIQTSSSVNIVYPRTTTWALRLQVIHQQTQPLWQGYTIGQIPIIVIDNSHRDGYKPGAFCYAADDPHMKTFDDKKYEMHLTGEFVMFQHKTLPILVHAFFEGVVNTRYNYSAVCGIAVQSGSDLIVYDACKKTPNRVRVYGCSDNGLKLNEDGPTYKITLPTGTRIQIDKKWPRHIYIHATSLDFEQASGLCGTFDGNGDNDMVLRNGSVDTGSFNGGHKYEHYNVFAESWKVPNSSSLYSGHVIQNVPTWGQREVHYCSCRSDTGVKGGAVADCRYTNNANGNCALYHTIPKNPNMQACLEFKKRSTTSTDNLEYEEPTEFPEGFNTNVTTNYTWKNGWNETNATNVCTNYITSIPQYDACSSFKDVDVRSRIETCVADIQISGGIDFLEVQKRIMLDLCENIFQYNQTLWTVNNKTGEVELPSILSTFCPSDCSGHGNCTNGSCVCDPDYTGSDCSGNLTHVPVLFPLPTDGLCDSSQRACLSTSVFADQFTDSSSLSCLLEEFVVRETGKISTSFTSNTLAMFYHDQKVACTLPQPQSDLTGNTLGYGFKVSVANTANAYSTTQDLVVYDSNCVTCSSDQVCQRKNDTCVIEAICYNDQDLKPGSNCLICDSSVNKWDWTTVENACNPPISTSTSDGHPISASTSNSQSTSSPTLPTTPKPEHKKSSSPSITARNLLLYTLQAFLGTITIGAYYYY